MSPKKRTILHSWHVANGGKMILFAGWEMPLEYHTGSLAEHRCVRRKTGLFDVSHMGRLSVRGSGARDFLQRVITSDLASLSPGASRYGLLLNNEGGVIDDLFLYLLDKNEWLLVVNASNVEKDLAWLKKHSSGDEVCIEDLTETTAMIAVQGPGAASLLTAVLPRVSVRQLARFGNLRVPLKKETPELLLSRTGYTGEDGFEVILYDPTSAQSFWEKAFTEAKRLKIEAFPVGLAARDSLRFEAGFSLYGNEISEQITPAEALLKWACDFNKSFIGREALLRQIQEGPARQLATIKMEERGLPRSSYAVLDTENCPAGTVVSGMYAPWVDLYAANVMIRPELAKVGTELCVNIRGKNKRAVVVKRPLYQISRNPIKGEGYIRQRAGGCNEE